MISSFGNSRKFFGIIFFQFLFLFVFGLSVHAQTFDVSYEADTLPTDATPVWDLYCAVDCTGTGATVANGILTLDDIADQDAIAFVRNESMFSSSDNVIVEFGLKVDSTSPENVKNSVQAAIIDGTKVIPLGFTTSDISFLSGGGSPFITAPFITTSQHTYRLVKHRDTEVNLCVDNSPTPILSFPYGSFSSSSSKAIVFGAAAGKFSTSDWDFVRYARIPPTPLVNGLAAPVNYEGDVKPVQATPSWSSISEELGCSGISSTASGGVLTITDDSINDSQAFFRGEPLITSSDSAIVNFRMKVDFLESASPAGDINVGIQDGSKLVSVGFTLDTVRLEGTLRVIDSASLNTSLFHTYRLVKNGSTNVELFVDNSTTPILSVPYSNLDARTTREFGFGSGSGSTKSVTEWDYLRYTIGNQPPVANAGADQTVVVNNQVQLDGSGSFDPDLDPLTYQWSEDSGNPQLGILSSNTVVNPAFTPLVAGVYHFSLAVNDGFVNSAADTVAITVQTPAQGIQSLIDLVETFNLQQGIENSLDAKLDAATDALNDVNQNNDTAAVNSLQAFVNAVEAQRGNSLTNAQADELIAKSQAIINSLLAP